MTNNKDILLCSSDIDINGSKNRVEERLDLLYDIVEQLEYRVLELENVITKDRDFDKDLTIPVITDLNKKVKNNVI